MRKNFGPKPYLYPQPVLIIATYGEDGTPDAMNAAWGGISDSNRVALYLSAGHKTVQNILSRKAFTVSMADEDHVVECDYVGIVSANQVPDKLARAGLHTTRSQFVDAPLIDELPMALECRFLSFDVRRSCSWGRSSTSAPRSTSWGKMGRSIPPSCAPSPSIRSITTIWPWERRWAALSRMEKG